MPSTTPLCESSFILSHRIRRHLLRINWATASISAEEMASLSRIWRASVVVITSAAPGVDRAILAIGAAKFAGPLSSSLRVVANQLTVLVRTAGRR